MKFSKGFLGDLLALPDTENRVACRDTLILDYRSIVDYYDDFQAYFRKYQSRFLAVWGKKDPAFLPVGAEAFKRAIPSAEVYLLGTGHFALETHATEISELIHQFLKADRD